MTKTELIELLDDKDVQAKLWAIMDAAEKDGVLRFHAVGDPEPVGFL